MAKSMRSKRLKRLKAIRREIVKPFYDEKDIAKLAAQEAALAAPKLPVRSENNSAAAASMDTTAIATTSAIGGNMEVEMAEDNLNLKPRGAIGKKLKKKIKISKKKYRGKGKIRRKHI